MDQPLDLSQRDSHVPKQYEDREMTDEPFCDIANCFCPKKHFTVLESPRRSSYESNYSPSFIYPGHGANNYYPEFSDSNGYKRTFMPEMSSFTLCHPKRRKMEIFKQKLARSVSDNDLAYVDKGNQMSIYQNNENIGSNASPNFVAKDSDSQVHRQNSSSSSTHGTSSPSLHTDVHMKTSTKSQIDGEEPLIKESSINHMERLPKKRALARHLSNVCNDDSPPPAINNHQAYVSDKQTICEQRPPVYIQPAGPLISESYGNSSPEQSWNHIQKPSVNKSSAAIKKCSKQPEPKPLSEKEKSFNALKADMMREIDNDKDDEDVSTFRKRFYKYCTTGAKAISSVMSDKHPGGIQMSALEYLVSKSLLQRENTGFKKRNDHIHQIIKGEKPGKLCLMDMVELQVEIGLA